MKEKLKRSICELCSLEARKRCQKDMTRECDRLLVTFEKAEVVGAKYHLFASGKCVFA
jgi:hypothetical protein